MSDDLGFLHDIIAHPDDPVPRLVYADWLDERDDPRGEFLRLELQFRELPEVDPQRKTIRLRLHELRKHIDSSWLAQLDRTPVENCTLRFVFECPQRWEQLRPTSEKTVRFCRPCGKSVYYCETVAEAREKSCRGECVAVDSRLVRTPGDLEPPEVAQHMMLGEIAAPGTEDDGSRPPRRSRRARQRRRNRRRSVE
jgi:uncharacterized protein (TIGR02996 family)